MAVDSAEPSSTVATQGEPVEIRSRIRSVGKAAATRVAEFELDGVKKGEKTIEIPAGGQAGGDLHDATEACGWRGPSSARSSSAARPTRSSGTTSDFSSSRSVRHSRSCCSRTCSYEAEFVAAALDPEGPASARSYLVERALSRRLRPLQERSPNVRLRLSAQRQEARRVRLGSAQPLRSRRWRTGGRAWSAQLARKLQQCDRQPAFAGTARGQVARRCRRGRLSARSPTSPIRCSSGTARTWTACSRMVPVYRYWPIKQPVEGTHTLLTFSDGAPALLERTFKGPKTGRVLLWTTPLSRRPDVGGALKAEPECLERVPVHQPLAFPGSHEPDGPLPGWGYQRTAQFRGGRKCASEIGADRTVHKFLVTGPDPKTKPRLVPSPSNEFLEVVEPPDVGIWSVKATRPTIAMTMMGFSVNTPRAESQFDTTRKAGSRHHLRQGQLQPRRGCSNLEEPTRLSPGSDTRSFPG